MEHQGGHDRGHAARIGDPRFMLLLDTLPYIAFVIARGGSAEHYNTRFVEYLGFRPGPDVAARTALHHPEDRGVLAAARAGGVATDGDYVVEVRLRRHDGAYRWHRIHNKPLWHDGRRVAYLGTAIDIHDTRTENQDLERRVQDRTAALAAEESRARELYNRTPMALHSADASARLVDVNDTWVEMFGRAREDVLGHSPTEFMTEESARRYREQAWPEMLASQGQVRVVDYQFVTGPGAVFDGRLSARGVFDGAGRLLRTWSAIADVTAEKEADRALQQAQRLDAIGQLAAGIAHDFNNLLTAILGNLELASRPGLAEARRLAMIAGARTAAERGARLTAQLLAFSRQQRITGQKLDVASIIEALAPMLASTVGEGVALAVVADPGLPAAMADATQLELAVLNLVINARDALDGAGSIAVTAGLMQAGPPVRPEEPPAGAYVGVEVRDSGPGIPDAVRDRMFEPFFTTKGVGRGSGLGLPQVLGIVKQLGGGLTVRSSPGEGTRISLLLPVADGFGAVAAAAAPEAQASSRSVRVLVVDDDPDVRQTAVLMLRDAGHAVTEAGSGPAALDVLRDGAFDMVLADMAMPEMSGAELAERVRGMRPGLPVVLMTGYADESLLPAEAWAAVLQKPFSAAELAAQVGRAAP